MLETQTSRSKLLPGAGTLLWPLFFWLIGLNSPLRQAWSQVSVLTQHNNNLRTGANVSETKLNTSNVNVNRFGLLFSRPVDGQIYAQPLYVPNLTLPGKGTRNVIFVATQHNSVYAFNADDAAAVAPIWQVNLGPSARTPNNDFGNRIGRFTNIMPEVGVTSTPVIDLASKTIYVEAFTKDQVSGGGYAYRHRLHALDLLTGRQRAKSPVVIQGRVPGTGAASINGSVVFDPKQHLQRASLLLSNGVVYLAFASFQDTEPYHGWLFAYNAKTLQQLAVFSDTPNGGGGGIWQSGQGPAADENGFVYLTCGNGTFSASRPGGTDFGMSVLKLKPPNSTSPLSVVDWFTPFDQEFLTKFHQDFGSCGPLVVPDTNLIVQGSRYGGILYVLNREHMGRYQKDSDSQIVQRFPAYHRSLYGSPVFWQGPRGPLLYLWGAEDYLKAFKLNGGLFHTTPLSQSTMTVPPKAIPGGILSLSANGGKAGTGIIWATHPLVDNPAGRTVAGILRAFDATDLSRQLWHSKQNAPRDDFGNFAKFCPPTIADGKVFLPTFSGRLMVYGLLPPAPLTRAPERLVATPGPAQVLLEWPASTGATSYAIKRATNGDGPFVRIASSVTATTYVDTGLRNGRRYYYVVAAANSGGESLNSAVASAAPSAAVRGQVISLNFLGGGAGGTPAPLAFTEIAGQVRAAHWNNAPLKSGSLPSLLNNWGTWPGASVTWSANVTGSTPISETPGDNRLMKGYLINSDTTPVTVQVSHLPASFTAAGYDVYVYFDNAPGEGTKPGKYKLGSNTLVGSREPNANFSGTFVQASETTAGNYVLFTNLKSDSFTLTTAPGDANEGVAASPISGLQIVARQPGR